MQRIPPPVLVAALVGVMAILHVTVPLSSFLAWPFNLVGLAPLLLGFGMAAAGSAHFARVGTNIKTFFLAADRWYIPFEEHAMGRAFGDRYAAYQRRVRRWL